MKARPSSFPSCCPAERVAADAGRAEEEVRSRARGAAHRAFAGASTRRAVRISASAAAAITSTFRTKRSSNTKPKFCARRCDGSAAVDWTGEIAAHASPPWALSQSRAVEDSRRLKAAGGAELGHRILPRELDGALRSRRLLDSVAAAAEDAARAAQGAGRRSAAAPTARDRGIRRCERLQAAF